MSGRAIFLGSKSFGLSMFRALAEAEPALSWTVLHPNDEQDDRSNRAEFRAECIGRGVGFELVPRAQDAYRIIGEAKPDVVFVCGWYHLLPAALLDSGPRFFGIHNSLLPKYRGGSPLVWAIIRGEPVVGSTLFRIVPGMDDGPVHLQVSVEPGVDQGVGDVLEALEQRYLEALPRNWPQIVSGENRGVPQDDEQATFCGQRRPEDGLIDWRQDAAAVHNFVRAQSSPYPGAFTMTPLGRVVLRRTRPFSSPYYGTPGQVLARGNDEVIVACGGETAIAIAEASGPAGEKDLGDLFPSLSLRLAGGN